MSTESENRMDVDRRRVLQSIVAATLSALAVRAQGASPDALRQSLGGFGDLSAALTGYPAPSDEDAAKMLAAFGTPERRSALTRLARVVSETKSTELDAALHAHGLDGLAGDLVAAWYSGVVTQGTTSRVVLYTDAYMWSAMSFTKPMGRCGGMTNYWADPPA